MSATKKVSVILTELERDRTTLAPRTPIVGYVRVSSDEQARKKTIDAQRTEVEAWAALRGLKLARIVADDGHSGTTISGRPGFSKLLTEIEAGRVGTLVCAAPDRLTRADDWTDRARIMQALKAHRTLLAMTGYGEIDPESETADMMLSQFFVLASMERKRMRHRTFAGKLRSAAAGKLIAGRPPFGRTFDRATSTWEVDEEEAAIYRRIFKLCLEGKSSTETVALLNSEGAPTPSGRRWRREIVSRLLRNESAVGEFVQLGHTAQIPPIVDRATFDAAQSKVEGRKYYHGARAARPRLLTGLLICAECGAGVHVRDKGAGHVYYMCGTSHPNWTHKDSRERPPCSKVWHKAQPMEESVWRAVAELLSDPAKLQRAAGLNPKKPEDGAKSIANAEKELKATDREEESLMRLYRRGLASETALERQLAEVQRNRKTAQQALTNAKAAQDAAARFQSAGADLAAKLKTLAKNVAGATAEQQRAVMIERFSRSALHGLKLHLDGSVTGSGCVLVSNGISSRSGRPFDTKDQTAGSEVLTFRLSVSAKRKAS